jgi:dUTP pyrophosphatase
MQVKIHKLNPDIQIPAYQTAGAAGFDLAASETIEIAAGDIAMIPTGLVIETPAGYALILASRSSAPRKFGITPPHGIGVVDSDYSGPQDEIKILVRNFTKETITINKGERIAQGLFMPVTQAKFIETDLSGNESRGGFGSTGH